MPSSDSGMPTVTVTTRTGALLMPPATRLEMVSSNPAELGEIVRRRFKGGIVRVEPRRKHEAIGTFLEIPPG